MSDDLREIFRDQARFVIELLGEGVSQAQESEREKINTLVQEHFDSVAVPVGRRAWEKLLERRRRDDSADPERP